MKMKILLMQLFILFQLFPSKKNNLKKLYLINEIILTISGNGNQKILSDKFSKLPDEILVNGVLTPPNINQVNGLTNQINIITMRWNSTILDCSQMFLKLNNILNINLSNFDTSQVTKRKKCLKNVLH